MANLTKKRDFMITEKKSYQINIEDVEAHAPIFFNEITKEKALIKKILKTVSNDNDFKADHFGDFLKNTDVEGIVYSNLMMNILEFRFMVIYHLCFSRILGDTLALSLFYSSYKQLRMSYEKEDDNTFHSYLLDFFNVNPDVVGREFINQAMSSNELEMAKKIIFSEFDKLRSFDEFDDYEDYFKYVKYECSGIIDLCMKSNLYGVADTEELAVSAISRSFGIPLMTKYYISSKPELNIEIGRVKSMQSELFKKLSNGDKDIIL